MLWLFHNKFITYSHLEADGKFRRLKEVQYIKTTNLKYSIRFKYSPKWSTNAQSRSNGLLQGGILLGASPISWLSGWLGVLDSEIKFIDWLINWTSGDILMLYSILTCLIDLLHLTPQRQPNWPEASHQQIDLQQNIPLICPKKIPGNTPFRGKEVK